MKCLILDVFDVFTYLTFYQQNLVSSTFSQLFLNYFSTSSPLFLNFLPNFFSTFFSIFFPFFCKLFFNFFLRVLLTIFFLFFWWKKLQRNDNTKLQATSLGPDLKKKFTKKTKIQSYRPNIFGEKSYRATELQSYTLFFLYNGKSYKETEIESQKTK